MIVRTAKELGQILREARIKHGMTQGELAGSLGVSRHSVLRIERGEPTGVGVILRAATTLRLALDLRPIHQPVAESTTSADIDAIVRRAKGKPDER